MSKQINCMLSLCTYLELLISDDFSGLCITIWPETIPGSPFSSPLVAIAFGASDRRLAKVKYLRSALEPSTGCDSNVDVRG